jgi:hypothetical protein
LSFFSSLIVVGIEGCFLSYNSFNDSIFSLKSLSLITDSKKRALLRVYCGHEYTLNNALFLESVIKDNDLSEKIESLKELYDKKQPSIPTTIKEEKKLNFFLKSNEENFKNHLNMNKANDLEVFTYLRHLKDTF